jgi:hypothetical protein
MRVAHAMIGNSLRPIEAPAVGLPVVNVGDRQAGRDRGPNVIDVRRRTRSPTRSAARWNWPGGPRGSGAQVPDGCAGACVAHIIAAWRPPGCAPSAIRVPA